MAKIVILDITHNCKNQSMNTEELSETELQVRGGIAPFVLGFAFGFLLSYSSNAK
jgi:hypothetical protein